MPVPVSYPGVYIEEIPSGVRTIASVATSIAAFIGWAPKGPTDRAQLVLSWSDYARQYGGLDANSWLSYAASHFFANGGQQAYIIRLTASNADTAHVDVGSGSSLITFTAKNKGDWANDYAIVTTPQSAGSMRFQVRVVYVPPGSTATEITVETFDNVSMVSPDPQGRFVEDVVNAGSSIVTAKVAVSPPGKAPATTAPSPKLGGGKTGDVLFPNSVAFDGALNAKNATSGGVFLLDHVDLFNLLCVPGETTS